MSFNQSAPTVPTVINASSTLLYGNAASANALTVRQFGGGNVFSAQTTTGSTALFVGDGGLVGIGTADPKGPIHSYTGRLGYPDSSGSGTSNVVARIQSGSICLDFGSIGGTNPFWIQNHLNTAWNTTYPLLLNPNGGSVGIGTTNPATALDVVGTVTATTLTGAGSGITALNMGNAGSGTLAVARGGTGVTSSTGSGSVVLSASPALSGTATFASITTSGNVGIGTASPSFGLDVYGATSSAGTIRAMTTALGSGAVGSQLRLMELNDTYGFAFQNINALRLGLLYYNGGAGVECLSVKRDNGYVGIGTTSPGTPLTIAGDLIYNNRLGQLRIQGATNPSYLMNIGVDTTVNAPFGYIQTEWAGNSYRNLALNAFGGYVGIGTASPSAPLHVGDGSAYQNGTSTITKLALLDSTVATNGTVNIQMGKASSTYDSFFLAFTNVGASSAANYAAFGWYNGNTVMAIQAQGRVGIGITNPSYPFHVNGTALSSSQNLKYIDYNSVPNWNTVAPGQTFLSIYGSGKIGTGDAFVIFSDSRIKIEEQTPASYLEIMSNVDVKNFSYIDKIQYGPQKKIGFFAQEVEKVLPDAVSKINDFIPNIFRKCSAEGNCVTMVNHGLLEGVKIRIISSGESVESVVHVVDENTIQVDKNLDPEVFVFGTEVDDFRVLNNDYMSAVAFGGLKELHALVKTQQTTIEMLTERLAALESKLAA